MIIRRLAAALFGLLLCCTAALGQFADQATYAGTGGGTANAQTITLANASSYADLVGVLVKYVPAATNTGATTINVNAFGNQPVRKLTSSGLQALTGQELVIAQPVIVMWDGLFIDIMSAPAPTPTLPTPQGYLTPCSQVVAQATGCSTGFIVPTGDVTVGSGQTVTNIYYTPVGGGNQLPIFNGASFGVQQFAELALTIPSSRLANTLYDVCVTTTTGGAWSASGTPTLVFGVAWTNSTAGSGNRGTGAGTAQIGPSNGILVNTVQFSGVNGATTISNIPAGACTYVATVLVSNSAGVLTFTQTFGQNRVWPIWNAYQQQDVVLLAGDNTATWTYNLSTPHPSNATSANKCTAVIGWPITRPIFTFAQLLDNSVVGVAAVMQIGIGWNVTNAFSGQVGQYDIGAAGVTISGGATVTARFSPVPFIGVGVAQQLEAVPGNAGSEVFNGTQTLMQMVCGWRG